MVVCATILIGAYAGGMSLSASPARADAWAALLAVHDRVSAALEQALEAEAGLALVWYSVLRRLAQEPDGRLRMTELSCCLPVTKSGLSRLADRMVESGLLERQVCPSDRRGAFAVLTPAGRAALDRATPVYERTVDAGLASLGMAEAGALAESLRHAHG